MKSHLRKILLPALVLVLTLPALPVSASQLNVVTSFSILADIVRQIGGDRVSVHSIVGADEDAHGYQPLPSDARRVRSADLVIANGLGFDTWLERLAQSAGHEDSLILAASGVTPLEDSGSHAHHGHDHGPNDPHAWQDVANARLYARNIAEALARTRPAEADVFEANARDYDTRLAELDAEIRSTMSVLPVSRRKVVTSHDAFAYFGQAYGLRVMAAAGVSHEADPSAAGIARLIRQLRRENVPVVFIENVADPRLIERIAREGGARIGGKLYSDALSAADGPAPTYIEMIRHNLATLMSGLLADAPDNEAH